MPDIDALFNKLIKEKGNIYVASRLLHESTNKVERWAKTGVPGIHKFSVYELLKAEGLCND